MPPPTDPPPPFQDLDLPDIYSTCQAALKSRHTHNFVVDFGGAPEDGGRAWCAVDLDDPEYVTRMLKEPRRFMTRTRWINIFNPYHQSSLVNAITSHYGFSPRLRKVITTPPVASRRAGVAPTTPSLRRRRDRFWGRDVEDVVGAIELEEEGKGRDGGMNYMNLVQNVWHFHAVEWGGRFICVGFNHHHKISREAWDKVEVEEDDDDEERFDTGDYNPEGKRLWSWLVLCDDGTVISIHEPLDTVTNLDDILTIRRNMLTVFRSLSVSSTALDSATSDSSSALGNGLDDLPFRRPQQENILSGPSLLLYYLFDDWHSSYAFVLGRGAPYSTQMRALRNAMHNDPQLSHLSQLHRLSRQLAMLRRMYETKKIIVDNILHRQENRLRPPLVSSPAIISPTEFATPLGSSALLGVPLGPLAVARFERLRDRIKLYVLGELDALLAEKTELETLTFNLISLKQSTTVELLTRVTIWFAGFTFVFLPLTLVTGYFSMQLKDVEGVYSQRTFWGSGGVTVALTLAVLYTVGKSTGTMQFGDMWSGVKRVWFSWLKKKREKRKVKRKA